MKKSMVVLSFFFFTNFFTSYEAHALSCAEPPKPEGAIHTYDTVVLATISDIKEGMGKKTVAADVSHAFKGFDKKEITFKEDITWGESAVGQEYLLFLNKIGTTYELPLCGATISTTGMEVEALVASLSAEETKEEIDPVPAPATEEPTNETDKKANWMLWLAAFVSLVTATIVGIILVQTKKN